MSNFGSLPGDIIATSGVYPGIIFMQPLDRTGGYKLYEGDVVDNVNALGTSLIRLELSPDQSRLLARTTSAPFVRLYRMDGSAPWYVDPPVSVAGQSSRGHWHPSGTEFAVGHATSPFVTRFDASTLAHLPAFLTSPPFGSVGDVKYSPDGTMLAVAHEGSSSSINSPGYAIYDLATGDLVPGLPPLPNTNAHAIGWSPDSSTLVMQQRTSANVCQRLDLATMTMTPIAGVLSGGSTVTNKYVRFNPSGSLVAITRANSPFLHVVDTSTWASITLGISLSSTPTDIRWVDDDVLIVAQNGGAVLAVDYSTGSGVLLGSSVGAGSCTAFDVRPAVRRKFAGTVTDGASNPLERAVRIVDRASGREIGRTVSDPSDGTFEVVVFSPNPAIAYCVGDGTELTKLEDAVTPVPIV